MRVKYIDWEKKEIVEIHTKKVAYTEEGLACYMQPSSHTQFVDTIPYNQLLGIFDE